jgi:hypothetical protein
MIPALQNRVLTLGTNFKNVDFSQPLVIVGLENLENLGRSETMRDILPNKVGIKYGTMFSANLSLDFHSLKDENMLAYEHAVYFCNAIKTKKALMFFKDTPESKLFMLKQVQSIMNLNEISGAKHIARFIANFTVVFWEEMEESVLGCDAKDILKINYQE